MLSNCFRNTEIIPLSTSAEAVTSKISKRYCFLKCIASLAHLEALEMKYFVLRVYINRLQRIKFSMKREKIAQTLAVSVCVRCIHKRCMHFPSLIIDSNVRVATTGCSSEIACTQDLRSIYSYQLLSAYQCMLLTSVLPASRCVCSPG
jgi:hypothetical protein